VGRERSCETVGDPGPEETFMTRFSLSEVTEVPFGDQITAISRFKAILLAPEYNYHAPVIDL
jgi:hypothetical protein